MPDERTHVQIGARRFRVVVELMRAALARFEKQNVALAHDFKSRGNAQRGGSGHDEKHFFRIAVEMIRRVVLARIKPAQVEVQILRADSFSLAGNVREQAETVDLAGIRTEIASFRTARADAGTFRRGRTAPRTFPRKTFVCFS